MGAQPGGDSVEIVKNAIIVCVRLKRLVCRIGVCIRT